LIIPKQEIGFSLTISEILYGLGIVLVVLGGLVIIHGLRMKRKEKKN